MTRFLILMPGDADGMASATAATVGGAETAARTLRAEHPHGRCQGFRDRVVILGALHGDPADPTMPLAPSAPALTTGEGGAVR